MKTTKKTNLLFLFLPILSLLLIGCNNYSDVRSKLEEELNNKCNYQTLMLKTGENIVIPIQPVAPHSSEILSGGSSIDDNIRCSNLPIIFRGVHFIECTGCDSCMQCFADYGLIKYKIKERTETEIIADIKLTSKGKKYLLYNLNDSIKAKIERGKATYITKSEENNEYLPVLSYETVEKTKVIQRLSDKLYLCKAETQEHITPFLKALGGKESDTKKTENKYYVTYYTYEGEKGEKQIAFEAESYTYELPSESSYNLDEYQSLENILKAKFNLSDTLATFSDVEYSKLLDKGLINKGDSLPNWFRESILKTEQRYKEQIFYILGSSYTLDKIIDTYDWKWSDTEKIEKPKWEDELYMEEVLFKVTRHCSPYDKFINNFESDKVTYYCRCPYIKVENTIYFPEGDGLWALSKKSVKEGQYGYITRKPQPNKDIKLPLSIYAKFISMKIPFSEFIETIQIK